jgi:hypothetical protein
MWLIGGVLGVWAWRRYDQRDLKPKGIIARFFDRMGLLPKPEHARVTHRIVTIAFLVGGVAMLVAAAVS